MKIDLFKGDPIRMKMDLLVAGVFEGEKRFQGMAAALNRALNGALQTLVKEEKFTGEAGKTLILHTLGKIPAKRVCLIGLGKKKAFTLERHRRTFARIVDTARTTHSRTIVSPCFGEKEGGFAPDALVKSATEGTLLGDYQFKKYLKKKDAEGIGKISLVAEPGTSVAKLRAAIRAGTIAAHATNFTRDLVNEPGNVVTPAILANTARKIARKGGLTCKILSEKKIAKLMMHAFLGVAQGSTNPPRFIHLTYRPRGRSTKKSIALIGKGITFDSGGLSLKPPASMVTMKIDKSGACTVLGVMQALPVIKPNVVVHGIIAAAENMPGGKAQRPDDIVRAMNGKSIEVLNTDAEGRLTLADALSYAVKLKPQRMIDMATLTGACVVALGEYTAGVMGNDKVFIEKLLEAADKTGERMWPLPFDENMKPNIKSPVADLKNIGNRWGGAITAGMFLEEFVGSTPWIHIDIAGPAFNEKGWGYNPGGATGVAVRTVLEYIESL
jgi:leucyl aminopeptidase